MIDALRNVLNGMTDLEWTELGWSEAPKEGYGVISLDSQEALNADADPAAEIMLTGYLDAFLEIPEKTKKVLAIKKQVEAALRSIGIWFKLESVQYEPETGFHHWTWSWKDTPNIVTKELYVIKFVAFGVTISTQLVPAGEMPDVPTPGDVEINGVTYIFRRWTATPVPATKNAVYTAKYRTEVWIINGQAWKDSDMHAFTSEQIEDLIAWFNAGNTIDCVFNGGITRSAANSIDENGIGWNEWDPWSPAPWGEGK